MPDSTFEDMWLCASCTVIRMCLRRCDIRRSVCDCVVACAGRFFFLRQLAADCCACCMRNRGWVAYHRQCQLNVSMSLLGVRNCMPTALYNCTWWLFAGAKFLRKHQLFDNSWLGWLAQTDGTEAAGNCSRTLSSDC